MQLVRFAVVAALAACTVPSLAGAITFTVSTTADTPDDSNDGLCLDASGECSLRAAITEANRTVDLDVINFSIPGGTPAIIDLLTALPSITKPVSISGPFPFNVVVKTTHGVAIGFDLAPGSNGSTVGGLAIGGFGTAIHVRADGCHVGNDRIGSSADGLTALSNTVAGVRDEGVGTEIGNSAICSSSVGLLLEGSNTSVLFVDVGACDPLLTTLLPNGTGILLSGTTAAHVASNVRVIGSTGNNVELAGATGTELGSLEIFGASGDGVRIAGDTTDTYVYSAHIHDNAGAGIVVEDTARNNRFSHVSIHDHGGLGIDLLGPGNTTGVTPNDADDSDAGANDRQNFPAGKAGTNFTTLRVLSGGAVVVGGLTSIPNKTYTIEYYQSAECDPSGFGEGTTEIATSTTTGCSEVTTDATGYADIGCQFQSAVNAGWFVTAVATGEGGTSEFSECAYLGMPSTTTTTNTLVTTSSSTTSTSTTTTHTTTSSTSSSTTSTSSSTTTSHTTSTNTTTTNTTTSSPTSTVPTTSTTSSNPPPTTLPPTTSTTSSTAPPGTTSSSTSTTIAATTSSSSSSSSTAGPITSTTASATSSSSTTTVVPKCGNGTVEPPELCDPAAPGSSGCCNPSTCLPFAAGNNCGLERDPCGSPVCDGAGQCVTRPALLGIRCREEGAIGPCDPGAFCGSAPYCPSDDLVSGCSALNFSLSANAAKVKFRCAAKPSEQGGVKCSAELVGLTSRGLSPRKKPAKHLEAVPASDCEGPAFDTTLPKKLAKVSRSELSRLIVARINKADRGYFEPGKTLCVRVRFTSGNGYSQTRLYNVTVPLNP